MKKADMDGMMEEQEIHSCATSASFKQQLHADLFTLQTLLAQPQFGEGEISVGAELEVYLVDKQYQPAYINQQILTECNDSRWQEELNRYNIELNLTPQPLQGSPFTATAKEMATALNQLSGICQQHHAQPLCIGILPTLAEADLTLEAMTDKPRYKRLAETLLTQRGEPFKVSIFGKDPLQLSSSGICLEGANTSMQLHLRVPPLAFADTFNAAQLATPLMLALAANSPILMGHALWHETRIALFKQAVDVRTQSDRWRKPSRVSFGHGWVRRSAYELFAQYAAIYPSLWQASDIPATRHPQDLAALRQHAGSIWHWNRPVYDISPEPHLRIEMRALPAGPTIADMQANMAAFLGLTLALRNQLDRLLPALPFEYAQRNFYRAARDGLNAEIIWPFQQIGIDRFPITAILQHWLPKAWDALAEQGVAQQQIAPLRSLLEARLENRQNGANWMLHSYQALRRQLPQQQALAQLVADYADCSQSNLPVSQWKLCR